MAKIQTGPLKSAEISQATAIAEAVASAVLDAIESRDAKLQESSGSRLTLLKGIVRAKDVVIAFAFFAALIGGAFITFNELKAKPSTEDTAKAIDTKLDPVIEIVDGQAAKIERIERKVDKLEVSSGEILEEVKYQGRLADCLALGPKGCPKPPKRTFKLGSEIQSTTSGR